MTKLTMRQEVESILCRELIGHEKAVVIHMSKSESNPKLVAIALIEQHLTNNQAGIDSLKQQRAELLQALALIAE